MLLKIFAFAMLFSMSIVSNGGTIRHNVEDSKYLEYAKDYHSVVKIYCVTNDEKNSTTFSFGSAVVIDAHWVLTAAHVVEDAMHAHIVVDDKVILLDKIVKHPDFILGKISENDIAICYAKKEIDIPFYPALYENDDETGKICGIAGFGSTGTGYTGENKIDNLRRAGSNKVDSVTGDIIFCTMSKQNFTSLEFCIAHGDSGGGLFIDGKLAGINSFVLAADKKPDSSYGDESAHTRVMKHNKWIKNIMKNLVD